ncbi:hypothetical protein P7K49_021892, partial [Saguinus oedipus]
GLSPLQETEHWEVAASGVVLRAHGCLWIDAQASPLPPCGLTATQSLICDLLAKQALSLCNW